MLATRSASGPMRAPRTPAPTSVGAPMMLIGGVMSSQWGSDVAREISLDALARAEGVVCLQHLPGLVGGLDEAEQLQVHRADHAGLDQQVEVDQPRPEFAPEQQHRPA